MRPRDNAERAISGSRIKIERLAIHLHANDLHLKLPRRQQFNVKDSTFAVRGAQQVSFKTCGPDKRDKQLCNLIAIAIAAVKHIQHSVIWLKVFPLVFYPGAFTLKVQIPDLLHAVIEPAQSLLWTGSVSNDFRGCRFYFRVITNEMVGFPIPLFAQVTPKHIRRFNFAASVEEKHLGNKIVFRRHVFLRLECRHVFQVQLNTGACIFGLYPRRHVGINIRKTSFIRDVPGADRPFIGAQPETFLQRVEIMLHCPHRIIKTHIPGKPVLVFNNAAHSHVRKGKRFSHDLVIMMIDEQIVIRLAGKGHDSAIRTNGPRLEVRKNIVPRHGYFDVCILAPGVSQNLDAAIDEFVAGVIVAEVSIVELHRGRAGIGCNLPDGERLGGNRQPIIRPLAIATQRGDQAAAQNEILKTRQPDPP